MYPQTSPLSLLTFIVLFLNVPWISAITSQLAPFDIDRTGWIVTADSSGSDTPIDNAFDPDYNNIWQTANVALPHTVIINMNNQYVVNGFSYTPRQDGYTQGNIGGHKIETSIDGNTYTTSAQGTWANDASVKTTLFTPVVARYIRLVITSEASNTGNLYASAAEFYVLTNPHATLPRDKWAVSASTAEYYPQSYAATYAIDGSPQTLWQSQWITALPALPHYFVIDQGSAVSVGGLSYLPRLPTTGPDGRIGMYQVQRSNDGVNWINVATGTWPDNEKLKFVEWNPVSARYWRLANLQEAGNRGPWTTAAEINLLDSSNNLANFVVTVDSEEQEVFNGTALHALDGNPLSFWHTKGSGVADPYPHSFLIDMQTAMPVKGLQYTPRQDGIPYGNIGQHIIEISLDNSTWTTVASGAFADNEQIKLVYFKETLARFVRLRALSEAGNRGPWASASGILLLFDSSYTAPAPQTKGEWGLTIDFPLVPVAVGLIPGTGGILAWSSWSPTWSQDNAGPSQTWTATYDPTTNLVSNLLVTNTQHDMFCPGISMDFNGRIVVTGGNDAPKTSIYVSSKSPWVPARDMKVARGYQSSATLSDGRIFTIGGSWSGGIFKKNGEVYNPTANTWTLLSRADVTPMLTADVEGLYRADNHAWLFGWSSGSVFQAGPSKAMNWYTTSGTTGGVTAAGRRGTSDDAMCGNAVMYDAVAGKILAIGGSPNYLATPASQRTYIVTIGAPGSQATTTRVGDMAYKRIFGNAVVLPNGQVFVVGGQDWGSGFNDDSSTMYPEIWSPSTNQWTVMAPMVVGRNYHSVALLMPDATVMVGGGGLCNGCEMNHYDAQIYAPPYLFTGSGIRAPRPVISAVSATRIIVGRTLTITVSSTSVVSFSMVRMGTATHTVNTDQRRIPLTVTSTSGSNYVVTIPSDPGKALPGYWMLFAMNSAGVPSISKTIQLALS